MASLRDLRSRISSVKNTQQVTRAMKMVAAAKLRRAQDAITRMRPYAEKLQAVLSNVSASLDSGEGVYSEKRDVKRVLLVAITSNRGLCGGFNNNIIKLVADAQHAAIALEHGCTWVTRDADFEGFRGSGLRVELLIP